MKQILMFYHCIIFADDIALFTTSPETLQMQLNSIYEYSWRSGLKINSSKTKICIFEKRKSSDLYKWTIYNYELKSVSSFCYLGVTFYYTGYMLHSIKNLVERAYKAYHNILSLFDRIHLDIKTKLHIFETMITPILLYSAEVWGIYGYKDIDKLQIKFYKHILGVNKQTNPKRGGVW